MWFFSEKSTKSDQNSATEKSGACIAEYIENTERVTLAMLRDEGYDIDASAG
jgi:hypothetical protein